MPFTDVDRVRLFLGEPIPPEGTEADTLFTNAQIQGFLDSGGSVTKATVEGWRAKAAEYSNLVDVSEGNSARQFSDLLKAALEMLELYEKQAEAEDQVETEGKKGRVVIGVISRDSRYR